MILTVTIDNANVISSAVTSAYNAKMAEIVAQLVNSGMTTELAEAEATAQLASMSTLLNAIFYNDTKCVLEIDSNESIIRVVGSDTL